MEQKACNCPNIRCPAHARCEECTEFHKGEPYCTSEKTQRLVEGNLRKYGMMGG